MSVSSRDKVINDFIESREIMVMIISLKAAAVGLNLVAANHVILLDPWWNPTQEEQAIDRAHRIGQTREVTVHRFVVGGTIEEKILLLQKHKTEIVDWALGSGESKFTRHNHLNF